MTIPTIPTDRLILRPLAPEDAEAVRLLGGDPRVAQWTASFTSPFSRQQSEDWISRAIRAMQAGEAVTLAITLRSSAALIGVVSLRLPENATPHLGYWLGAENWGKGYCTEAVRAMIHYGFRQLGLRRISARCDDDNAASKHVMLRCGMRKEQRPPMIEEIKGRRITLVDYGINRDDEWR
ncbi:GNAT family N-acetyltransferase [Brenneria izadpanahii]|uniref:GNAT family N-acetyltransferase n=1 Tax=Brenneria izadpanahii TaxID=2722756 RepID=A0ABX7UQ85_9GAMM|nr:GNAT family N-acetyltransferase [Brenneria izadpanahii]QTF06577.1 GNAT family N-acetyltransferase [Brenneria izadpanahii]